MGTPVLSPGPTTISSQEHAAAVASSHAEVTRGTTDARMTPRTSLQDRPSRESSPVTEARSSSPVSDALVEMRQCAAKSLAVEQAEHGLRVAHIDCEEHV